MKFRRITHSLALCLILTSLTAFISQAQADAPQATIVDTTDDTLTVDGKCSLREAIRAANTGLALDTCVPSNPAVIQLPAGTYLLTRAGASEDNNAAGDLDIHSSLTLQGAGIGLTIIDAHQIDRAVQVFAGASVLISGVTIRNGKAPNGADADPTTGSGQAGDGQNGGGIASVGVLTLQNVEVTSNQAGNGGNGTSQDCGTNEKGGRGGSGGGIYNSGILTLDHSLVHSNWSGGGGSANTAGTGGDGGGIVNLGELWLTETALEDNHTGWGGAYSICFPAYPVAPSGSGGGLFTSGSAVILNNFIMANSTVLSGDGGGIYITSGQAVSITGSTITGNWTGDGSTGMGAGSGGGIFTSGNTVIKASAITANYTGSGYDYPSHYGSPSAGGPGGGIFNDGNLALTNTTISGNHTGRGGIGGILPNAANGDGGGIFNAGSLKSSFNTIANNQISGYPGITDQGGYGGGIFTASGVVTLQATILAGNTAFLDGPDCSGRLDSPAYSLIESLSGCQISGSPLNNLTGQRALIGPLADNGGPTLTHALIPGSPAVDFASCVDLDGAAVLTDQRGVTRPQGQSCDIGALEYKGIIWKTYLSVMLK